MSGVIGIRIAEARRQAGIKQVELAAALGDGISRSMVSMIETGENQPSWARTKGAAQVLHVSLDWLAGLTDDPAPADERQANTKLVSYLLNGDGPPAADGPYRPVPVRELAAAAGGGAVDLDETIRGWLYFRREWLDRQAIDPTQADVIQVRGESMEPTLPDGCSILMDRRRREPRSGRVYVVRTEEGIVVKRARRDSGRWILSSDHPAWPPRP